MCVSIILLMCVCVIPAALFVCVCACHYLSRRLLSKPFSVSQCSWIWFIRQAVKIFIWVSLKTIVDAVCVCATCLLKVLWRPPESVMVCSGRYWGSLSYRWTHNINICTGLGSDKSVGWTHTHRTHTQIQGHTRRHTSGSAALSQT